MPHANRQLSDIGAFARRHDPDRFLCSLFAPAARREAIFALIGFNHELARAREAARTPIAALVRLQWWREVVEGAERRHEVATPLRAAIAAGAFDPADLLAMIDAREIEAEEAGIPDRAAFAAYLHGTAGGWSVAAARALGAPPDSAAAYRLLGAAYGCAGVLRSVAALAAQGRCVLPQDALAQRGLNAGAVIAEPHAAGVLATIRELADLGIEACDAGLRANLPRAAIAAALPAILAVRDLRRLRRGQALPRPYGRGLADRCAVLIAGFRGHV